MLKKKSSFNSCVVLDIDETLVHTKYTTDKPEEDLKKSLIFLLKLMEYITISWLDQMQYRS